MATETFELAATPAANPTLEESAAKLGIDPAKVDATAEGQTATKDFDPASAPKERPENIPEKFWDAEKGELNSDALLKSYTELEKTKGKTEDKKDGVEKTEAEKVAEEAATKSGLNLDELSSSFWENDGLSDEQYEALEKGGYPKHIVDEYIEGQRLIVERDQNRAFEAAGGPENYAAMIEWAGKELDTKDTEAYNKAINSGNINTVVLAVTGLKGKYQAAVGNEPKFVQGGASKGGSDVYESAAQMKADMADPRYKTDHAFRTRVEQKVGRSSAF